jgi:hypothetical protein
MPIYGTEMTVWTRYLAYMRVNGDGMRPKLRPDELVVVNMAIQTLSDDWNLLSIHGRQLGAKGARIGVLGLIGRGIKKNLSVAFVGSGQIMTGKSRVRKPATVLAFRNNHRLDLVPVDSWQLRQSHFECVVLSRKKNPALGRRWVASHNSRL